MGSENRKIALKNVGIIFYRQFFERERKARVERWQNKLFLGNLSRKNDKITGFGNLSEENQKIVSKMAK